MTDTPAPHDEREALARLIVEVSRFSDAYTWRKGREAADRIIAAGYGKPRVQPTVEDVAGLLATWGVRSGHGEWTDAEAQRDAATAVLALFTNQPTVQDVAQITAERDELREKVAYLRHGCARLSRDELIKRITAVGREEMKAGYWLAGRDEWRDSQRDPIREAEIREQVAREIEAAGKSGKGLGATWAARVARGEG